MFIPRLRPEISFSVEYLDETPFGAPLTSKLDDNLHQLFSDIRQARQEYGPVYVVERSKQLLESVRSQPDYLRLLDAANSRRISPEVLFPDAARVKPVAINIMGADQIHTLRLDFHPELLPALHDVFSVLCGGCSWLDPPAVDILDVCRKILETLEQSNLVLPPDSDVFSYEEGSRARWTNHDVTFVGHNTVVVRSKNTRIIVDPWFLPRAAKYPKDYQPVLRSELGEIDAVLITHSHPDHFEMGSLLQFSSQTKIIIPKVEKESVLAIDMGLRLRELGFEDIQVMDWWQETSIGDIKVVALPFYGEQPTNSDQLCPEVRNMGNTYLVSTPGFSCAFLADSGRDRLGDVRNVALEAYRRWGAIDALFAGYRGWNLYPIQYVWSSVSRYLLFVPPELYTVRQTIMNNVSEAVDTAEAWHARYFAPYADGGAPWYWERGLGPALNSTGATLKECLYFDPLPERCLEELRVRSAPSQNTFVGSVVSPLLLRPGQSVQLLDGDARIIESKHHSWPWAGQSLEHQSGESEGDNWLKC